MMRGLMAAALAALVALPAALHAKGRRDKGREGRGGPRRVERMAERLSDRLDLSDKQAARVREILERQSAERRRLRSEFRERLGALRAKSRAEIRELLDDGQKARFDGVNEERRTRSGARGGRGHAPRNLSS